MARTPVETANTLSNIYDENFVNDEFVPFRIKWPELRSLAGMAKLTDEYLAEVNRALTYSCHALVPFDDFLLVTTQGDCANIRYVTPRLLEQFLPGDEETETDMEEDEVKEGE